MYFFRYCFHRQEFCRASSYSTDNSYKKVLLVCLSFVSDPQEEPLMYNSDVLVSGVTEVKADPSSSLPCPEPSSHVWVRSSNKSVSGFQFPANLNPPFLFQGGWDSKQAFKFCFVLGFFFSLFLFFSLSLLLICEQVALSQHRANKRSTLNFDKFSLSVMSKFIYFFVFMSREYCSTSCFLST